MFGLAHRAVLLAPAEDAFDHRPTRLRHAIAFVPRGASVDGAPTTLAGCGDAVVLRHMRRNVDGAQMGHMVDGGIFRRSNPRDFAESGKPPGDGESVGLTIEIRFRRERDVSIATRTVPV